MELCVVVVRAMRRGATESVTLRLRAFLMEAVRFFSAHGYTNESDLQLWLARLHALLERELPSDDEVRSNLTSVLERVFTTDVDRERVVQRVPSVTRYTLARLSPRLHAELDRRIYAGIDLIKLNRAEAVARTLKRFSGWVSSVGPQGSSETNLRAVVTELARPSQQSRWEVRRVAIDQGHKLSAAIAHVVAEGEGAIAAVWHDRGSVDHTYNARKEHLARSGKMFLVRNSWAITQGLIARGSLPYTDEIEAPAELIACSCFYTYILSVRNIPNEVLTEKGRAFVAGR